MKRKLRIFSNIAIIALSVCMFAFGVYAASTVSVSTTGTVTFNATGVYAKVTRTVIGTKTTVSDLTQTIDESATDYQIFEMGKNESLQFTNAATPIVMTFTIENLATDRNLDITVPEQLDVSGNVITAIESSEPEYVDSKVNVNPNGIAGDTQTVKIYFYVKDPNLSANLEYNFTIGLNNQQLYTNTTTATGATSNKVGNTYLYSTSLATTNTYFEKFAVTGSNWYDYMPYISGTNCIVPIHMYGTDSITYTATVNSIPSDFRFDQSMDYDGLVYYHNAKDFTGITELVVPLAANSDGTMGVVVEINQMSMSNVKNTGSVTSIKLPNTLLFVGIGSSFNKATVQNFPRYARKIDSSAFTCVSINFSKLPNTVEYIDYSAFDRLPLPSEFTLPRDVEFNGMMPSFTMLGPVTIHYLGTYAQFIAKYSEMNYIISSCNEGTVMTFIDGTTIEIA